MANTTYELGGKVFLKCKECGEFKEINKDNRYFHPQGYLGVSGRCKECVKIGRRSEKEREMARKIDSKRYYNNPKRRKWLSDYNYQHRRDMGYGAIHTKTEKKIKDLGIRPSYCPICNKKMKTVAHHPDYSKWYEIVFCCQICHSKIHKGKIVQYNVINLLKF